MEILKKVTSCDELQKFIDELHKDYEIWYAKSVRRVSRNYYLLQGISVLAGFLTSILSASIPDINFGTWRIVLIILPLVGSLSATILLQFRIYVLWNLREEGRIAFQNLVSEGRKRYAASKTDKECFEIHESLQLRVTAIENEQKDKFFSLSRSDFILRFKGTPPNSD